MAKLYISSKEDKAKAQRIEAAIDNGDLPRPPAGTQKRNVCEMCGAATVLRDYIKSRGQCCNACSALPTICNTRADQVHRGRYHIVPQCVTDAETNSNTPVVDQDAPKARAFVWDAKQAELRWTATRKASEARRGNVMVMPWAVTP